MNLRSLFIKIYKSIRFRLGFTFKMYVIKFATRIITESFLIYLFLYTDKYFFQRRYSIINNDNNQVKLEMKPYGSSDCILQYLFVAANLAKLGLSVNLMLPNGFKLSRLNWWLLSEYLGIQIIEPFSFEKKINSLTNRVIVDSQDSNSPRKFSEKVNFILSLLSENPKIALAAIDTFVRTCKYEHFFESLPFEENFFLYLVSAAHYLKNSNFQGISLEKNDYIIMAETAYLENVIYRHINECQGTKIKILNPHGMYIADLSRDESEFLVSDKRLNMVLEQYVKIDDKETLRNAQLYKCRRFLGKGEDKDSQAAYKNQTDCHNFELRKVLFLHAIRDANNLTSFASGLFNTYFEWVEFMAEAIAKNNPDSWYIKLHPSSSLYQNDEEIIIKILSKYGLEKKVLEPIPSTKIVLDIKMPVFTHSGTIALETASLGYKSIVVGSRYSDRLVKKVTTYEELYNLIAEKNNQSLVELISDDISQAATIILYNDFGEKKAFDISPNQSVLPSTDSLDFAINELKSVVSLMAKLSKKPALSFCLNMAADIK